MYIWLIPRRGRYPALPAMAGIAGSQAEAVAEVRRHLRPEARPPRPPCLPEARYQTSLADSDPEGERPCRAAATWP
jgi:hypothetical protein